MMYRKWLILLAVSFMFLFVTGATFTSLGVVLFTMMSELHWSHAAGGICFSVLGLTCGLASPLPTIIMDRLGTRLTMFLGSLVLAVSFALAAVAHGLVPFVVATGLMGIGFTLVGTIPGVHIVAAWFPARRDTAIGMYLLSGGMGGVVGPAAVTLIVGLSGSWRLHWLVMAITALVGGLFSLAVVADAAPEPDRPAPATDARRKSGVFRNAQDWSCRQAVATPQFALIAATMILTLMCTITVNSATVAHLAARGMSPGFGASVLALQALAATLAKGASGPIGERYEPRLLLGGGLFCQAVGMIALSLATDQFAAYGFAVFFGLGWGAAYFAANVLVINYFGRREAPRILASVWLLSTVATGGPLVAGVIADRFGTYSPVFNVSAALLLIAAGAVAVIRPPALAVAPAGASGRPAN
jgi:MFS family permease